MNFSTNYGVLIIFLYSFISVHSQTSNSPILKWKNEKPANATNPGLAFIPVLEQTESTLIRSNRTNFREFANNLEKFLDVYYHPGQIEKDDVRLKQCSYYHTPRKGEVCAVDIREWEPCSRESYFQYHRNSPCVFLKLHTIDGWMPEYYNDSSSLPEDMPNQLKDYIKSIERPEERNKVWITCAGEYPEDVEYLGPVQYHPHLGFPGYYFLETNTKGYLSPLIAVHFERVSYGVVVNVECRAWAKNIKYNKSDRSGSVHFEIFIE